jgi:hypothetical protein
MYASYSMVSTVKSFVLLSVTLLLGACVSTPPTNVANGCSIFEEKDDWYEAARDAERKWGVPVEMQLAFIKQESGFRHDAQAPRDYLLGIIPLGRKSSAYGYGQVIDSTWEWYKRDTGNRWADRDDFEDVADFIGWYAYTNHRKLGISRRDTYRQYLAYHEGQGGYLSGSYRHKSWLLRTARRVERQAARYRSQIARCEAKLQRSGGWLF